MLTSLAAITDSILSVVDFDLVLDVLSVAIGLIYLWFEYHANPLVWVASIIKPLISMWLYYRSGLYADFAINIYYVAIAVYGYMAWTFKFSKKDKAALPITHIGRAATVGCTAAFAALWVVIALFLIRFTDSTVPWLDAFTTALSIVAMWMLARKYAEQWLAWLVVDAVCTYLYIYKGISFNGCLYGLYTVMAWVGYRKWLRMMAAQESSDSYKSR